MQASSTSSSSSSDVHLSVTAKKSTGSDDVHDVLVSVRTPSGSSRTPADVCCVIDVSGSMGTEATLKTAGGQTEGHGLSLLDIVKHAVKTIICALLPQDRLAIVVYSTRARTVFDLGAMDEEGKKKATEELERLGLEGSTNIWDGLRVGLDLLREKAEQSGGSGEGSNRLASLLLLTDGQPTDRPEGGEVSALKAYKEQHPQLSVGVNTFGFGYGINSELLRDLAVEGNGAFAFIPDSSFVGTSFIHAVGNLLTTMARTATLAIEPSNGASLVKENPVPGGLLTQVTTWGASINLCSLQHGQTKDVIVRLSIPSSLATGTPYLTATLKYLPVGSASAVEVSVDASARGQEDVNVDVQRCRVLFVEQVRKAMDLMKEGSKPEANKVVESLVDEIVRSAAASQDERLKALAEDTEGQVKEAFSRDDWYQKWGQHYLPSLVRAHLLQQCNNFKDPGVQVYGGDLFKTLRDEVDEIFVKLPPPKPSVRRYGSSSSHGSVSSMAVYHSSGNPCFAGDCLVSLADGRQVAVKNIKKGDLVATSNVDKPSAEVLCVVKTVCFEGKAQLVELDGGLVVTPYHPIRVEGKWRFPRDLGKVIEKPCPAVYSFVLKEEHVMVINGIQCVSLGHSFNEDEVVAHEYFGSKKVVEDLEAMRGWNDGVVELGPGCLARDRATGLVCGFQQS